MRDKGRVVMVLSANTFPSLVKVTYTGQSRALSAKKREVIATWLKTYGPKNPEYSHLFETELLFTEGKEEYWLPVQAQVIPYFEQELQKGENVNLYLVWVGARRDSGKIEHVFLVNEFEKKDDSDEMRNKRLQQTGISRASSTTCRCRSCLPAAEAKRWIGVEF